MSDRVADSGDEPSRTGRSRRQFLGLLGAGVAAGGAATDRASDREAPIVELGNDYFEPAGLHVEPGTTVRFEVVAGSHSATAYPDRVPAGAEAFDSTTMSGGSFEHTFEEPGTYDYYCTPHRARGMVGRIVVGEPGGPAEESPIPDGEVPDSEEIVERGAVTGADAGTRGSAGHGEMTGAGPGMMGGHEPGWMVLVPVGVLTTVVGLVGAAVYWATRRGGSLARERSAQAELEARYARGEIDEEEFRRRRRELESGD